MCFLICISEPAGCLLFLNAFGICRERKWNHSLITKLFFHPGKINAALVCPGRCSCFKTEHFNSICDQRIGKMGGCLKTIWPCRIAHVPVDASCPQICSSTQYNRFPMIYGPGKGFNSLYLPFLYYKLRYFCLADGQMLGIFHGLSHLAAVFLLIRLGS